MSRRNRPPIIRPAGEPQPIAEDSGGPWYLKAPEDGTEVKPFLAVGSREELAAAAREIMDEVEEVPAFERDREKLRRFFRSFLAEECERAAARARGMGRDDLAPVLAFLADVARGE